MALRKRFTVKFNRDGSKTIIQDGIVITQAEFDAQMPSKPLEEPLQAHGAGLWPMYSEALAVHPLQVDAANDRAKRNGLAVCYEKGTGVCKIDSRADRAKLLKLESKTLGHAVFDKKGGYGDG